MSVQEEDPHKMVTGTVKGWNTLTCFVESAQRLQQSHLIDGADGNVGDF